MRFSIFSVQDHYPDRHRSVAQLYDELLAQAELADALGYDSFFVAEHHFHEYGVVPDPSVMLAAIAQRTTRMRLGPAIAVLPFHHPVSVAERYAMVDVLSSGRLVLGVGSGYLKHEFDGYAVDPAEKRERFDEGLAILKRALTGERFSFAGRFTTLKDVAINVRPAQASVPIYVAILRKEGAYHVGKQGHDLFTVPYASVDRFEEIGDLVAAYQQGRRDAGLAPGDVLVTLHTHVAETDDACRAQAAQAFDLYVATRLYAKQAVYDDILRSGLGLFGSPETVAAKLLRLHEMGVRHVVTLQNFGLMPAPLVHSSMRLLAERVRPLVEMALRSRALAK